MTAMKHYTKADGKRVILALAMITMISIVRCENHALGRPVTGSSIDVGSSFSLAVDGDFQEESSSASCWVSQSETRPFLRIEFDKVIWVRTIYIANSEDNPDLMVGSQFLVGNSTDIDSNLACPVAVDDGGLYGCDLWGRYLYFTNPGTQKLLACEIAVYSDRNITPFGTASQESTYVAPNPNAPRKCQLRSLFVKFCLIVVFINF